LVIVELPCKRQQILGPKSFDVIWRDLNTDLRVLWGRTVFHDNRKESPLIVYVLLGRGLMSPFIFLWTNIRSVGLLLVSMSIASFGICTSAR
jgi:hypothetical protein